MGLCSSAFWLTSRKNSKADNILDILEEAYQFIEGYSQYPNIQIKLFTVLYNVFSGKEKYHVFMRLLSFCESQDWAVVLLSNLKKIDQISATWDIDTTERITMYQSSAEMLIKNNSELDAYNLMLKTLELLGEDESLVQDHENLIILAVIIALHHPKVTQFDILGNSPAIKVHRELKLNDTLHKLLNFFTFGNLAEYTTNSAQFLDEMVSIR